MKSIRKILYLALFALLLQACNPPLTSKRTISNVGEVELAPDAFFQILPLTNSELEGTYNQTVTGIFQGRRETFLSQVEIEDQEMTMVGLATFGARIFTLKFNGTRLEFATIPQLASKLRSENLLADFQLVNWPLELIDEQFQNRPPKTYWFSPPRKLEIKATKNKRDIFFGGLKIIDITYTNGEDGSREVVFKNLAKKYELHITQYQEIDF